MYCSLTHLYSQLPRSNDEVGVRRGAERISHYKEGYVLVLGAGVDAVRLRLDHIAVGQNDVLAVESLLVGCIGVVWCVCGV